MARKRFGQTLFVLCCLARLPATAEVGQAAEPTAGRRPNILWLIAEDFGPHLGCYGTPQVWTPNLDKLAAEGVRYTRAFTTAPICSPSRSAFLTGMYQTTLGAHHHRSHRGQSWRLPAGVRVLPDWLRDAGYFTANVRHFPKGIDFQGSGKNDWNFASQGQPWDSDQWEDLKAHQPFYAQVNFGETHRGFRAPRRADPAKVVFPPYYPDHPVTRADWAAYLDAASELDRKAGLVLKQLAADGLADNTVVLFFADNGQAHVRGKEWCYDSGLHVPLLIRWPKNFPAPAPYQSGTVDGRLLEALDLTATTLAIAGVNKPARMQGRVFLGNNAEPDRRYVFGARDRSAEAVFRIRTVRDARYRYIRNFTPEYPFTQRNRYKETSYPVLNLMKQLHAEGKLAPVQAVLLAPRMPAEELYDLEKDPHESENLAASEKPKHRAALKRLRAECVAWMKATHDLGLLPEYELDRRAAGRTPYDVAVDPALNPLEHLLGAADLANGMDAANVPHLVALLQADDAALRWWGATGLAALGARAAPAKEALHKSLQEESPAVRLAAAEALCNLSGYEQALPVLVAGLKHDSAFIRLQALNVLDRIGDQARSVLPAIRGARMEEGSPVAEYVNRMVQYLPEKLRD
jgi:arylsulfatase A-like enzyme